MEFLIVSSSKLKIMMSREGMEKFGISDSDEDYSSPEVRRALWKILDTARDECGFDVSGDKILIQFYPTKDGCEIFVTKLGKIGASAERSITKSQNVAMLSSKPSIYKFPNLEALISASKNVLCETLSRAVRLYASDDGEYYLMLEERNSPPAPSELLVFGEFAKEVPKSLEPYIIEHSEHVASVSSLSVLAEL